MKNESRVITAGRGILSGVPVLAGSRVPIQTLIDYLEADGRLDDLLEDFPIVTRERAMAALDSAREASRWHASPPG